MIWTAFFPQYAARHGEDREEGPDYASVAVELDNGDRLTSVCTVDSAEDAGIAEGVRVQAAIKAPHVILSAKN